MCIKEALESKFQGLFCFSSLSLSFCVVSFSFYCNQNFEKSLSKTNLIILFNGPSSVGKTTTARLLNSKISNSIMIDEDDCDYEGMGYGGFYDFIRTKATHLFNALELELGDKVYLLVKEKERNRILKSIDDAERKNYLLQILSCLSNFVADFREENGIEIENEIVSNFEDGYTVIDVTVYAEDDLVDRALKLTGLPVIWVGLRADEASLTEREIKRGDRRIGASLEQNKTVHKNAPYDIFINSSGKSPKDVVDDILSCLKNKPLGVAQNLLLQRANGSRSC